jgi:Kef-type K+ transport system membrane component KefB
MASGGTAVLLTGAAVPICIALGFGFFAVIGVRNAEGNSALMYLAACMSLSSTLVVVKILNDKFELDTLPGRITLGVLVIQDLWAVGMLAVQPNILNPNVAPLLGSLLRGAILVGAGFALAKYALPYLFRSIAKAPGLCSSPPRLVLHGRRSGFRPRGRWVALIAGVTFAPTTSTSSQGGEHPISS